jgi:hypothetical protein
MWASAWTSMATNSIREFSLSVRLIRFTSSLASLPRQDWPGRYRKASQTVYLPSARAYPRQTPSTSSPRTPYTPAAAHASAPSPRENPSVCPRRTRTSPRGPANRVSKWSPRSSLTHPRRQSRQEASTGALHTELAPPLRKTSSRDRRWWCPYGPPSRR